MNKEVISQRQGVIMIILYIIGSSIIIGSGSQAKQDAWLAVIIGIFGSCILLTMLSRILSLYPGKDLFDILQLVMGKFIGKIVSIIMIWFAFHLGTLVLKNLSDFTQTLVFPDTPAIVPMSFFVILIIWGVKEGIEVLGRWSEFFIWIVIFSIIFVTTLSITQMDINRLKPILGSGLRPVLRGALSSFSFPFAETVVFTMVISNIADGKGYYKTFLLGLCLGGLVIFVATTRNTLVLGSELVSHLYYPSYMTVSLIHVGELLQRLEIANSIVFVVCAFVKIVICVFAICNGVSKVLGLNNYKFLSTPVALLMLNFSFFIYKSTMEMANWANEIWPYYAFVFEVIPPLIIFIMVEVKIRSSASIKVNK